MPVLTSPDVLPEAMRYITRVLLAQGGTTPKSELHRIIAPSGLQGAFQGSEQSEPGNKPGQIIVTNTLTAMASIGLVTYGRGDDADVTLVEEFADRLPKWDRLDDAAFASFFAQEAIDDRNLETESEDNRDADGSERGDGAADRATFIGVVRNAHPHQQRTDVGETETERAVAVTELGDAARGE